MVHVVIKLGQVNVLRLSMNRDRCTLSWSHSVNFTPLFRAVSINEKCKHENNWSISNGKYTTMHECIEQLFFYYYCNRCIHFMRREFFMHYLKLLLYAVVERKCNEMTVGNYILGELQFVG